MGVEYAHGLFVLDLMWRPEWRHVVRLTEVLTRWKLARNPPALWDTDEERRIDELAAAAGMPANLRIDYKGPDGAHVEGLMGPSQYALAADRRYLQSVTATFGVDFHVLSCESYPVVIEVPPIENDAFVELDEESEADGAWRYRVGWTASPPTTAVKGCFSGVWRAALVIDCGKDLPEIAISEEPLPASRFCPEVEEALETAVVEQGWIH